MKSAGSLRFFSPDFELLLPQVRVRSELKSPVKTIEDFLRRFTPSRLASGCSSIGNLTISKSSHKSGSGFLPSLSQDSVILRLEEKRGQMSPAIASNGYSSQAAQADGWTPDCSPEKCPGEQMKQQEPELRYEAESPDEAALVYAARAYSCTLVDRRHDQVSVELPHLGRLTFELLHTLGFDSIRKRMSVVIRHPLTDEIIVYTKGADSVIMDLLLPCSSGNPPLPLPWHPSVREGILRNPIQLSKGIFMNRFWRFRDLEIPGLQVLRFYTAVNFWGFCSSTQPSFAL